ncbi:MAG: hypothetical protein QG656_543 [Candidatus Hydrogenedentes bacterium]|nr:hypothetical protein [Candidatus Hydrogenedentota bacterium]
MTGMGANALLALDTLAMRPTRGIATGMTHVMDMAYIEARSGHPPGSYRVDPDLVYLDFQRRAGICIIDQYLATNPLTMADHGYENGIERTATTGAGEVVLDGITIDSPESVVEHLERFVFPALEQAIAEMDDDADAVAALIQGERDMQALAGPDILKAPYAGGFQCFPYLRYTTYGYVPYLTAYLAYPEVMERDFSLQADLAVKLNTRGARAIVEGGLPKVLRSDHDMADSRGTLVDVRSLDRLWFPHFQRAIQPLLDAGVRLLWHCDGNLMEMVPRLLACGIAGFQGFQYEDGMDYARICCMTDRDGGPLTIWAGASVTRTLPFGTPDEVRAELRWLVDEGPRVGLFLGASSSVTPGVPWVNLDTLIEGLTYYREHGRS